MYAYCVSANHSSLRPRDLARNNEMIVTPIGAIDTAKFAQNLRRQIIDADDKSVRIVSFSDSLQGRDLTLPSNCAGFGRIHHFRRFVGPDWPENPLPIDPAANYLGTLFTVYLLSSMRLRKWPTV